MIPMRSATTSSNAAFGPSSRRNQTAPRRSATTSGFTVSATASSGCSVISRSTVPSPHDMTNSPIVSLECYTSQPRVTGSNLSTRPSTTLADLLRPPLVANPFSTMRASLRRSSSEEFEDGVAYGGQSWLRRRPVESFFPPCCCEPAMLEEGVSDHRHKRMTVKALPGSSLGMVKTKLFFHLLVSLLANPALCNWPDHPHIGRVHLEVPRNTDCPSKFASCEPLAERRAQPIT